jgi:hypothetical protein
MQAILKVNESSGMTGEITIREHPKGTIAILRDLIKVGQKASALSIIQKGRVASVTRNLIMQGANTGKDLIIQRLCTVNTYTGNILWGEIGTSSAVVAITDTKLGLPTARTATATSVDSGNNQAQLQFFFTDASLANQTYTEFGTFVDGSATLSSGQLFNHALFTTPYVKAAGTDITVAVNITIN